MTTIKEITELNDQDLVKFINDKRVEIRRARFSQTKNVSGARLARRDVARAMTVQTGRLKAKRNQAVDNLST